MEQNVREMRENEMKKKCLVKNETKKKRRCSIWKICSLYTYAFYVYILHGINIYEKKVASSDESFTIFFSHVWQIWTEFVDRIWLLVYEICFYFSLLFAYLELLHSACEPFGFYFSIELFWHQVFVGPHRFA